MISLSLSQAMRFLIFKCSPALLGRGSERELGAVWPLDVSCSRTTTAIHALPEVSASNLHKEFWKANSDLWAGRWEVRLNCHMQRKLLDTKVLMAALSFMNVPDIGRRR